MFARIARYGVPPERMDEAETAFREAAETIGQLSGLKSVMVMVDRENGTVVTTTTWETRAALEASEVRASRARQEAVRAVEGDCNSVDRLEVIIELSGDAA